MSTSETVDRVALCQVKVTLNGKPARISGYRKDFATVTDMTTGLSAEWAWPTVQHIVTNRSGKFTS